MKEKIENIELTAYTNKRGKRSGYVSVNFENGERIPFISKIHDYQYQKDGAVRMAVHHGVPILEVDLDLIHRVLEERKNNIRS